MNRRILILGLLILILAGTAAAQAPTDEVRVRSFVQPAQGLVEGQLLTFVVQIDGAIKTGVTPPRMVGLTNLQVVRGPEQQFTHRWVNGRASTVTQLIYTMRPESAGTAAIPPLAVVIDGQTFPTEAVRLEIGRAPAGSPPLAAPSTPTRPAPADDPGDVFLRAQLSSNEVWVGESLTLAVTLYAGAFVNNARLTAQPSLDDFWIEEIEVDGAAESNSATVNGRIYRTYHGARKLLVPQSAGEFTIDPFAVQMQVRARSGDVFDLFSLGRTQVIERRSAPLTLRVRQLPAQGRPSTFGGAVGRYTLRVTTDRQEAQVGDAVALRAIVEGDGFLKLARPPVLEVPPDVKVLDPRSTESSRISGGKLLARKTWEWVVVPLAPGEVKLPALRFDYFDPRSGEYRAATAPVETLQVQRGSGTGAVDVPQARGEIRMQRREIAFIKPLRGELRESSPRVHEQVLWRAVLLAPLLWVPAWIVYGRYRDRLSKDRGLARSRRARSRARRTLQSARRRLSQLDSATFHQEVARALVEYVADRFNRSAAGLTYELADELLASRGVEESLRRRFRTCLESCDFARFVPAAGATERREEVLAEATGLVDELERAW